MPEIFRRRVEVRVDADALFAWHERPDAFRRLTPPWAPVEVIEHPADLIDGARAVLRVKAGGVPLTWTLEHRDYQPGVQFRDVQLRGPFGAYAHTHRVEPTPQGSALVDEIEYTLPLSPLGKVGAPFVRRQFEQLFAYRHRIMTDDLTDHQTLDRSLTVAVSGASGLVGRALTAFLRTGGHTVVPLVRGEAGEGEVAWDPDGGRIDAKALEGVDAVVHLAGEPIMGRWTDAKKRRIRDSRVEGTRLLAEALARLDRKPAVLVSASAVGYYGDRGDTPLTEDAAPGDGFLADVCLAWETAAEPAAEAGIRVVHPRLGIVLSGEGGALDAMLTPFKLGLGGPVGSGDQHWSWVAIDDVVGGIHQMIADETLRGPVNMTAPEPVTSRAFAKTLGKVLSRPAVLKVPGFALKLAMGEAADEMLLAGQRVLPTKLEASGYRFRYADLEEALRYQLGKIEQTG